MRNIQPFAGFSGAGVWRMETDQTVRALRRWPTPGLPSRRLRGLHRLLEHLARQGVGTVAVPIADDHGETLVELGTERWQLEPWLPGQADFLSSPSPQRLENAMTALARWHAAAATFRPPPDVQEWFGSHRAAISPAVCERLAILRGITPADFMTVQRRLSNMPAEELRDECLILLKGLPPLQEPTIAALSRFARLPLPLQPCLRDIWHDHVLFTGEQVTGLIDASACRSEHIASDLARLIGSLVEDDRARWQQALEIYYRHHPPITLDEVALVPVLDRAGIWLSAWTWLRWLVIERRTFSGTEAVLARLRHLQRRVLSLANS